MRHDSRSSDDKIDTDAVDLCGGMNTEKEIYVDVLFALNFSMNYVSLYLGGKILHRKTSLWRIVSAAAVGAILGIISVIADIHGILLLTLEILAAVGMSLITFGFGGFREILKSSTAVFFIASLIGGVMTVGEGLVYPSEEESRTLSGNFILAICGICAVYAMMRIIGKRAIANSVQVRVNLLGRQVAFTALVDSGNLLREPISSRAVILVSRNVFRRILDDDELAKLCSGRVAEISDRGLAARVRAVPVHNHLSSVIKYGIVADKVNITVGSREKSVDAVLVLEERTEHEYGGHAATCPSAVL